MAPAKLPFRLGRLDALAPTQRQELLPARRGRRGCGRCVRLGKSKAKRGQHVEHAKVSGDAAVEGLDADDADDDLGRHAEAALRRAAASQRCPARSAALPGCAAARRSARGRRPSSWRCPPAAASSAAVRSAACAPAQAGPVPIRLAIAVGSPESSGEVAHVLALRVAARSAGSGGFALRGVAAAAGAAQRQQTSGTHTAAGKGIAAIGGIARLSDGRLACRSGGEAGPPAAQRRGARPAPA